MLRPRERASLRPLFPPQEGVSDPFSHRKRENLVHPPNPLAQIPLAQRIIEARQYGYDCHAILIGFCCWTVGAPSICDRIGCQCDAQRKPFRADLALDLPIFSWSGRKRSLKIKFLGRRFLGHLGPRCQNIPHLEKECPAY